jgi:transketolase
MRDSLYNIYNDNDVFEIGGSHIIRTGSHITIATYGDIIFQALEAAEILAGEGIEAEVIDFYSVKPFDQCSLEKSITKTGVLLVAENHQARNGLGYEMAAWAIKNHPVVFNNIGLEDKFGESGEYLQILDKYGISSRCIAERTRELIKKKY